MNQITNLQRIQSGLEASTSLRRAALKGPLLHPSPCHGPCPHRPLLAAPCSLLERNRNQRLPFKTAASSQQDPDSGSFWPSTSSTTADSEEDEQEINNEIQDNGGDDDEEPDVVYKNRFSTTPDFFSSTSTSNGTSTSSTASPAAINNNIKEIEEEEEEEGDVLIEFRNVHKSFGSKKILKGASFKIRRGEAVGIIGSSGTGKSTTLRLAAGLLQPDSGEVLVKGEARQGLLSDDDTSDKLKVGLVFQSGALFDSLTVKENVGFMLYEHSDLSEDRIEAAVASSLSKVGLSGVENLYPSELSGGMKKRVALARAIVTDTTGLTSGEYDTGSAEQLIMYDEPTAGLDPVASTVIEDLIRNMHDKPSNSHNNNTNGGLNGSQNGGTATHGGESNGHHHHHSNSTTSGHNNGGGGGITSYVVVTHQHSTIRRAVDKIIFLHDGKVVWEGSVEEFDTTDEPIVRQFASGSLQGPIVYV